MAGTAALKAGNTNDDVARRGSRGGREHGLAGRFICLFIGHGIGIGANEPPVHRRGARGAETVVLQAA